MEKQQNNPIKVSFDDFEISEDSFRPMTKGLGFHQERPSARTTLRPTAPKRPPAPFSKKVASSLLNEVSLSNKDAQSKSAPKGLEAFYGERSEHIEMATAENHLKDVRLEIKSYKIATSVTQFFAWSIDLLLVIAFALVTTIILVLVSGLTFKSFLKIVPLKDLVTFAGVLFSIYYLLYFTVLDLTATPGKTILGIKLIRLDDKEVSVKNTFARAFITLLSLFALLLPNLIDFQGRLSESKVVEG